MEQVPAYIAIYLLRIGRHSGEAGYLKRRLENADRDRAVYEKTMVKEALALNLIAVTGDEDALSVADKHGDIHTVTVPNGFILLARAHYLPLEMTAGCLKWMLASVAGALIALAIGG